MTYKYKTSYGIALCRYNASKNNQPEILLIKKRYTYCYFSFVFGHYKKYNNKHLQYLFNNMSFGEKVDVLSMKFSNMWYRLWLSDPEKNHTVSEYKAPNDSDIQMRNLKCYFRKKNKFESIFLRDSGKRLRRLINNSSNSVTPWEIPKGGKNENETDIDCAKREFEEETSLTADKYTILWNASPIISSHKDGDTIYRFVYYIATFNIGVRWHPKVKFDTSQQLSELEQVQWVSQHELNFLNLNEKSKNQLLRLFHRIISTYKKSIKNKYNIKSNLSISCTGDSPIFDISN
jgi:8-oxo-dGTP pyrophosphatase MutT (NUDIX family)